MFYSFTNNALYTTSSWFSCFTRCQPDLLILLQVYSIHLTPKQILDKFHVEDRCIRRDKV